MPSFDYKCNECGELFEVFVKNLSDQKDSDCPVCKSTDTKKVFVPFSIGKSKAKSDVVIPEKCQGCSSSGVCGGM